MSKVRQTLLAAENGVSVLWISPKKVEGEENCPYPDAQLNFAKIKGNLVEVRQFQSRYLDLKGSARFINELFKTGSLHETPELAEVMLAVKIKKGKIETQEIQSLIAQIGGKSLRVEIDREVLARRSADKYLEQLLNGLSGGELVRVRSELLKETLPLKVVQEIMANGGTIETSCGQIEFSRAGGAIPNWCEITLTGEIRCKLCKKGLKNAEVGSHRCAC